MPREVGPCWYSSSKYQCVACPSQGQAILVARIKVRSRANVFLGVEPGEGSRVASTAHSL
jgi:hypothetical protein